jgi:2-amino-4-hydroxy-6-hydroxymethyldihydropteridine diphosphokinase
MNTVYIGVGSNLGNPHRNCLEAILKIGLIPECKITGLSHLYRTEPVGIKKQAWYVNGVVALSTRMEPRQLLDSLLLIEKDMGRVRQGEMWEARIIDLDILLFDARIIHENDLTVPHPLMHTRRFVMLPMAHLSPQLRHPSLGKTMVELLETIPLDGQLVEPIGIE